MAKAKTTANPQKLLPSGRWRVSWRRLLIVTSITLNIGFVVIWIGLSVTNSLDGLFIANGLERYCSSSNDDKYKDSSEQVKALRDYVCDTPDAHKYFQQGLSNYLDSKGLSHTIGQ